MRRSFGLIVPFLLSGSLLLAQPRLDQEQVNILAPENTVVGGSPQQRFAQAFTVGRSGLLAFIAVPMGCQPVANVLVTVEETTGGVPNGIVLARQTVPGTFFTAHPTPAVGMRLIQFDLPLRLQSGVTYAFTLDTVGGDCALWTGPDGDTYTGGRAFFESASNPPGWIELFFTPGTTRDLAFQVYLVDRWGRGGTK
ncbi:MAG TPA: hypothetical protein VNA04_11010 [Thermoanaerobaculia bacterium]|nr:hypothetical protein [Thermoanaerobaculia bacterium]